jgi:hypothetical protein
MPKFRKKPVVIEARQYDGTNADALAKWINEGLDDPDKWAYLVSNNKLALPTIMIPTLEGNHNASLYYWIIKGIQGEFYPCKPEIFDATYEAVDGQETQTQAEAQAETEAA